MRDEFYCMSFLIPFIGAPIVEYAPGEWVVLHFALANENNR